MKIIKKLVEIESDLKYYKKMRSRIDRKIFNIENKLAKVKKEVGLNDRRSTRRTAVQ